MKANRESMGSRIFSLIICALMILFMMVILYPIYYMIVVSLSSANHVMTASVNLWPRGFTANAYKTILSDNLFLRSYLNTLLITLMGTLTNIAMTSICAYPLSRSDFYGVKVFTGIIAFTMFFSGGLIPAYLLVNSLGLINSYWAIILPGSINVFNMIVMRTFFQGIPNELRESAGIDGANDLVVFLRIVLPLSRPILATMILFYAVGHWNGFLSAVLYLTEKEKYPIQLYVRNVVLSGLTDSLNMSMNVGQAERVQTAQKSMQYAVIVLAAVPILAIYPFVSKFFEKGVMIGSIKG